MIGERIRYQEQQIDDFDLRVSLTKGKGTVDRCLLNAGLNRVSLDGNFLLPTHSNAFIDEFVAHIGIAAAMVEPARFLPILQSNSLIVGSAQIEGGNASGKIHFFNAGLKLASIEVPRVEATLCAVARLPLPKELWSGCAAVLDAGVSDKRIELADIEKLGAVARLEGGKSNADVELNSGKSDAHLHAELPLPIPGATVDLKQVDARLRFHFDSIADFIRASPIRGSLIGDGEITVQKGQPVGDVQFNGDNLRYGDFSLPRLALNANAADGSVKIRELHAAIDDSNYLDATGVLQLSQTYPYEGTAAVHLIDLSKLESLLVSLRQPVGLRGTFEMTAKANGDFRQSLPHAEIQANGYDINYRGLPLLNLNPKAKPEQKKATIETVHISFDPHNSLDPRGALTLTAPVHYNASEQIQLDDLRVFDSFLKSIGPESNLTGSLSARLSGNGEFKDNRITAAQLNLIGPQIKTPALILQTTEVIVSLQSHF